MLRKTLGRLVKYGRLTVIRPDGTELQFGGVQAAEPWPDVAVRLAGTLTSWKLALHPDLYFGELYMDGALILERGTLWDLLELLGRNLAEQRRLPGNSAIGPLRRLRQSNSRRAARRHVAHHYDLSHQHYRQFLDTDLQYSCAYFADASLSLEQAQEAKKRHIAAKLLLQPGLRVLDIGCGWGGLALSLAEMERVEVVGVTLSREQLALARQRASRAELEERVRFILKDYREIEGRFDRIVSVGMFEHVGVPNYGRFFQKISGTAERRWRRPHPFDRPHQWPGHHECLDTQVYFPGRTHPGSVGGGACHRARGPVSHRFGGPAPALRRNASSLARAFSGLPPPRKPHLRRAILPDVGILPRL